MTAPPHHQPGADTQAVAFRQAGGSGSRRLTGTLTGFAAVLVAMAVGLQALDRVPGWLVGLPRGAVRVNSIDALERALGAPFPLPAFYPNDLVWPPTDMQTYPGPSAVVIVNGSRTGEPALVIGKAAPGLPALPAPLLPPFTVLQSRESTFGVRRATVARVQDASGALWHEVSWHDRGQLVIARYRGDLGSLFRMVEGMIR